MHVRARLPVSGGLRHIFVDWSNIHNGIANDHPGYFMPVSRLDRLVFVVSFLHFFT